MNTREGKSIYYELCGPADSPVLVLSHALGTNLNLWNDQVKALRGSFRILRYDSRGHGRSSADPGPYTISLLAADVLNLLDELGVTSAHFCGISMGGMIGQYLAIHHPERISSLVLSNTATRIGTREKWDRRIQGVMEGGMPAVLGEVLAGWFSARFRSVHGSIADSLAEALKTTSVQGYIGCCEALRDADLSQLIGRVKAPALIIAGTEDQATTLVASQFLHQEIRGSQLVALKCAHLACVEASAEFTDNLSRFLTTKASFDHERI
jgi:3-oxoadipate enol-lactonase